MTIDDYIDLAMANREFASDRELGRALGFKGNPVNHWRTKRAWPADPTMIRLAQLAGVDPVWALVELNIWRSQSTAVRNEYAALLRLVEKARGAAALLVAALAVIALAAQGPETGSWAGDPSSIGQPLPGVMPPMDRGGDAV